jgi:hypothetical protein
MTYSRPVAGHIEHAVGFHHFAKTEEGCHASQSDGSIGLVSLSIFVGLMLVHQKWEIQLLMYGPSSVQDRRAPSIPIDICAQLTNIDLPERAITSNHQLQPRNFRIPVRKAQMVLT